MRKVTVIIPRENGVSYHRLSGPFAWLHHLGKIDLTVINGMTKDHLSQMPASDIVVFNRLIFPDQESTNTIIALKEKGIKLWCDIDDYWHLHPGHLLEHEYRKHGTGDIIAKAIQLSDIVTCTHDYLARKIRHLNQNVHVVPNAINTFEQQWKHIGVHADANSFGWMGSAAHKMDIDLLARPLKKYWQSETAWKIMYAGYSEGNFKESEHVQKVLAGGGKYEKKRFLRAPAAPVEQYAKLLDAISVGLIPLADNEFNRCKSELKVLEFAAKGKAVIVSNIHPYTNIINEDNAFICDEPMDFYRHMMRIERQPMLAVAKAHQLIRDCQNLYNWNQCAYLRLQITNEL